MRATRDMEHVDFRFFLIVVFWLLLASLIPFTSSLIGEHNELLSSHVAYGLNLIAVEILVLLRDFYLRRHPELSPGEATAQSSFHRFAPVTVAALVSMAAALRWPDYASLSYLLLMVLIPLSARIGQSG